MSEPNKPPTAAPLHGIVLTQSEVAARERKWWAELRVMADQDDVAGWYRHYAKYLEWNNVISPQRQLIHRMAIRAAELLS